MISSSNKKTIGPFVLGTDGSGSDDLVVKNSGTKSYDTSVAKSLFMNGSQVFMFTMRIVPKMVNDLLKKSNHDINDIDLFIFHQASKLVLDNIERLLKIPGKKVFKNYSSVGNTVSSSIPIALAQAEDQGMIKKDSLIMLAGFGVGLSWGATLISLSKK